MSAIEDFKNAPIGATATNKGTEGRAMKVPRIEDRWVLLSGLYVDDESMVYWGYTLDLPAPTTAREALDLAWELAHPVKEGQVIPAGTDYLVSRNGERPATMRANLDQFASKSDETNRRTLDPLPDPEPDWLDALVVLARHVKQEPDSPPTLWANLGDGMWGHVETTKRATVRDLRDVTPLYPKEGQDA